MMELGLYLRQQREKTGLSLRLLGERVGVSKQYLFSIEMGEVRPTATLCAALAHHLHLDSDVLLLMAGHTPRDILTLLQENPQAGCALLRQALSHSTS